MLIDTHAHLYWEDYKKDLDQVIQRALDSGVNIIINVGVDIEKSKIALEQAQEELSKFSGLSSYSTIGIHPHESIKYSDASLQKDIDQLEQIYLSNTAKVVAVGECGLDFFFDNNPDHNPSSLSIKEQKDLQRKLFQAQIDLAKKLNLPLIVHCRDDRLNNPESSEAWNEVINMTKNHFGIYHCYSGLPNTTHYLLQTTNFLVSFAATVTYPKNEYLREAAKVLPLNKMVLETDCPFLPPQSKRGQRNEPANLIEVAKFIANLKGVTFAEISAQSTKNVKMMFNL